MNKMHSDISKQASLPAIVNLINPNKHTSTTVFKLHCGQRHRTTTGWHPAVATGSEAANV